MTGQTVALFSLKSIMFSREPVVFFFSVLDAHVADNLFIVQFATAALKSPHKIRPESQTKLYCKKWPCLPCYHTSCDSCRLLQYVEKAVLKIKIDHLHSAA